MDEGGAAAGARHPDGHRPRGAVEGEAEAIVVLRAAGDSSEAEVARIVRRCRPALDQRAEGGGLGGDEAAIGVADGEDVVAGGGDIGLLQLMRQLQSRRSVALADDVAGEVSSTHAELAVVQRVRCVVGPIDQNPHDDQRPHYEQRRQPEGQAELQRGWLAGDHEPASTRR